MDLWRSASNRGSSGWPAQPALWQSVVGMPRTVSVLWRTIRSPRCSRLQSVKEEPRVFLRKEPPARRLGGSHRPPRGSGANERQACPKATSCPRPARPRHTRRSHLRRGSMPLLAEHAADDCRAAPGQCPMPTRCLPASVGRPGPSRSSDLLSMVVAHR